MRAPPWEILQVAGHTWCTEAFGSSVRGGGGSEARKAGLGLASKRLSWDTKGRGGMFKWGRGRGRFAPWEDRRMGGQEGRWDLQEGAGGRGLRK